MLKPNNDQMELKLDTDLDGKLVSKFNELQLI